MTKRKPREHTRQAEIATQCGEAEELMVRGIAMSKIVTRMREKWGVSEATVYKRIQNVRDAWRAEAANQDRTALRDSHRERLLKCYSMCVNRRSVLRDGEANPVLSPKTGKPVMIDDPDLRSAGRYLDSIAKLDALNEETIDSGKGQDLVTLMNMAAVADKRRRELGADTKN